MFIIISPKGNDINLKSILKGMLERIFLIIALANGFTQALALFGALKIGTRIHNPDNTQSYNDYYLVGNLLSALSAIIFVYIYKNILQN